MHTFILFWLFKNIKKLRRVGHFDGASKLFLSFSLHLWKFLFLFCEDGRNYKEIGIMICFEGILLEEKQRISNINLFAFKTVIRVFRFSFRSNSLSKKSIVKHFQGEIYCYFNLLLKIYYFRVYSLIKVVVVWFHINLNFLIHSKQL